MDVTSDTLLSRLSRMMRDTANKVYSVDDKVEALTQAMDDDELVARFVRDDSTTITYGTNTYDIADGFTALNQILIDADSSGFPIPIDPSGYDIIDNAIWINRNHRALPDGSTLIQIGWQKLNYGDNVPQYLVAYILHNAASYLIEMLMADKTGRFLKNDTSFSELAGALNEHRTVAARYERMIQNRNTTTL